MKTVFSAISLDELEKTERRKGIGRSRRRLEETRKRVKLLQTQATALVDKLRGRYQLHERLLLLWYSRRSDKLEGKEGKLFDPLARWRTWWRFFGVLLLLAHCACAGLSAWVSYRCDADPSCNLNERRCPDVTEWLKMPDRLALLRPGTGSLYGCRRDLIAQMSAYAVRAFSAVEIGLGLRTGLSMIRRSILGGGGAQTAERRTQWAYGTSVGVIGFALLLLDAILLLSPERAIPRLLARMRLLADGEDGEKWWSAHATAAEGDSPWSSWCNHHEWCRDNNVVRAVVGYQRLAALPAAPAPIQFLIDKSVEYFLPTQGKKIRALPTVGDFLLEGALMQAFIAEFLFSAKVVGLVLSILKAHRVRRAAEELRRESACRSVVHFFRRVVAHRRVERLQQKDAWLMMLKGAAVSTPAVESASGGGGDKSSDESPAQSPVQRVLLAPHVDAPPMKGMRSNLMSAPSNLDALRHRSIARSDGWGR